MINASGENSSRVTRGDIMTRNSQVSAKCMQLKYSRLHITFLLSCNFNTFKDICCVDFLWCCPHLNLCADKLRGLKSEEMWFSFSHFRDRYKQKIPVYFCASSERRCNAPSNSLSTCQSCVCDWNVYIQRCPWMFMLLNFKHVTAVNGQGYRQRIKSSYRKCTVLASIGPCSFKDYIA